MGQQGSRIKVTESDKAMLQLKMAKDELHRYSRRTENLIGVERAELRTLCIKLKGKQLKQDNRARLLLKRIHYQERLLEQCSDQIINLETMVQSIEFKLIEKKFIDGLQKGNQLLKKLNVELNLEKVESIMDTAAEQIEIQREIDDALSNAVVGSTINDEVDRELEQLDREVNGTKETAPGVQDRLDQLPSTKELGELKASEPEKENGESQKETPKEEPLLA
ncbi:ESCRT-III subunit protein VPS20 [Kluyveromyces lactis]|uniref:KLLA0F09295p n=1 Tax=Kluyveromyces lactis (strain ATCC 8585 / CBS 2359 / DSM 70799 / NBRC 1267 / NRRL Y-1140 / WM37) TaxID=284590 RepID=Q6CKN6_KLULA|nr:uncharacterized protein KLLA0_F09295g [Kluyveromyces lactis]CAG98211.1 KLLA0F09295p [Kluyveromyces lactis]|eukprot:XP_455503.1 uncharacterized protein KLLA0_F09295g [Kluyveromyces lactis]